MLFKVIHLKGIKSGTIKLAFRKWKKPSVKKGTLQHSPIGQIQIIDIALQNESQINAQDAIDAGYLSLNELKSQLDKIPDGDVYRINIKYFGEDPRIKLRNDAKIADDEIIILLDKLNKFDQRSKKGTWTKEILSLIQKQPKTRAQDLADLMKVEKTWFKSNVRKLKNLGLTISHEVGYTLSPRGKLIFRKLLAIDQ